MHLVSHPLVHDALATLRDASTPPELFRRMAVRISLLLAAEATRDVPATDVTVQTPLGPAAGRRITRDVVVVPVLRAGLGMLDAVLELIPTRGSDTSACSATRSPRSPRSTIRSCRRISSEQFRPDDRSDAGHRRQRGRGARSAAAGRRAATSG